MLKNINDESILIICGICIAIISIGVGRFIYTPIIPDMQESLDYKSSTIGLIASFNYLGYLIGSLFSIFYQANIFNRYYIYLFTLVSIFSTISIGITTNLESIIIFRFFNGISSAIIFIIITSIIFSIINSKNKMIHFSGIGLGIILSSILIFLLNLLNVSWRIYWISGGLMMLFTSFPLLFLNFKVLKKINKTEIFFVKTNNKLDFILISLGYCFFGLGYIIFGTFIAAMTRNYTEISYFEYVCWFIVGCSAIPAASFFYTLGEKIDLDRSLFLASLICSLGTLILVIDTNYLLIIVACLLFGFGVPGVVGLVLFEGEKRFKTKHKLSVPILTFAFSIGQIIGPYLSGILIDGSNHYNKSLMLSSISLTLGSILMLKSSRFKMNLR